MLDPRKVLEEGVEAGLHGGAQLYVRYQNEIVFDFACGEARPGIPMRTDSLVQWLSTGKPLTAVLLARLYERGEWQLDDPVARFLPEFGQQGKDSITLRHLLTHTAGIRSADKISPDLSWEETTRRICATPIEEGWKPGERAGYSTGAAWHLLAEIIQRITRVPFDVWIKRELLDPLGMTDSWLRLPFERHKSYGERLALLRDTATMPRNPAFAQDAAALARCRPGSSARGPIREIGFFYQMLLDGGMWNGHTFLEPETIQLFTRRLRTGLFDETFLHKLDFGLGFIVNSNRYGPETVPYGYGRSSSEETFGHSGAQSSCAFADPRHNLAVAWVANGLPGERAHQKRQRAVNNAIYEYLDLAPAAEQPGPV